MFKFTFPPRTVVGVVDKESPNYGRVGTVTAAIGIMKPLPPGWVYVEFQSISTDGKYYARFDCESLVSILALGQKAFQELIDKDKSS